MIRKMTIDDLQRLQLDGIVNWDPNDIADELTDRGHVVLGTGGFAVVLEMPGDPSRVIRVSAYEDGWVSYALTSQHDIHAPRVDAFGHHSMRWFAVVERLEPVAEADQATISALSSVVRSGATDDRNPVFRSLCDRWPALPDFIVFNLHGSDDVTIDNMMMRGDVPVFNDPYAEMSTQDHDWAAGIWRMEQGRRFDLAS